MRKRNVHVQVWLNRKEAETLNRNVKKSGLSREVYLRHLINGTVPREAPPADYYAMMNQLHRVGNSLNQIAAKANALGFIDAPMYQAEVKKFEKAVKDITEAVVLPAQTGK